MDIGHQGAENALFVERIPNLTQVFNVLEGRNGDADEFCPFAGEGDTLTDGRRHIARGRIAHRLDDNRMAASDQDGMRSGSDFNA